MKAGNRLLGRRIAFSLGGVLLMGFGTSLSILSGQGADPCSCFNLGMSGRIGLPFWLWQGIANSILFIMPLLFARRLIGFGTVANMFLCGIFADLFRSLYSVLLHGQPGLAAKAGLMLAGTLFLGAGCSLYTAPAMGLAPYDSIPLILTKKTHLDFRVCRISWDVLFVLGGWLLGSAVGIGTVAVALGVGPILHFLVPVIQKRFLSGMLPGDKSEKAHSSTTSV